MTATGPQVTDPSPRLVRALRWTRLVTHIAVGLLMTGLIFPRVRPTIRAALTQLWAAKLLRILNIVLSVHGAAPGGLAGATTARAARLFVVSNHVSWLDIFVINAAQPSRFVAKSEIRHWPIAGLLCEFSGTIFVQRTKRSDTTRANAEIHDALEQGDAVAVFPEGTTTAGDRLLKFHTSLFEPAVANAATLAPAAIRYRLTNGEASPAALFIGDTTFTQSMSTIIAERKMIAEITFAPAIDTTSMTRREAALAAEDAIAAILNVPKPHLHQRFGEGATHVAMQAVT